jgi:hypothetical protein
VLFEGLHVNRKPPFEMSMSMTAIDPKATFAFPESGH